MKIRQENVDAKHQIRRPEIGCILNELADRTNLKLKWLINPFFLIAMLVKWILIYTYLDPCFLNDDGEEIPN